MSLKKFMGVLNTPEWVTEYYDFAKHGGTKNVAIPLVTLADNTIVHDLVVETVDALVGATATIDVDKKLISLLNIYILSPFSILFFKSSIPPPARR